MQITKRNGQLVEFDKEKVVRAVDAAYEAVRGRKSNTLSKEIASTVEQRLANEIINKTVESIQDEVERELSIHFFDVAKAFIIYRATHAKDRQLQADIIDKAWAKTDASNVANSNANVDEMSFGGRKNEAASVIQKEMALAQNMPEEEAQAHKDGLIYIHDLDYYNLGAHNCLNIDFKRLLTNGFKTRNADVRPPSSFSTACQLMAVIFQIQSQDQFGGVGTVHIDFDLAPYVAMSFKRHFKDGLRWVSQWSDETLIANSANEARIGCIPASQLQRKAYEYAMAKVEREGKQAAQGLVHNLGTLESRAGAQVPFSSINYGRDTSPEGRMVTRWMLEASIEGVGKHHTTSIFPIGIFSTKKGINADEGDPNYDLKLLAIKSMSARLLPNFANGNWSQAHEDENDPDTYFSTMGCRTMLGYDRHSGTYKRVGRGNNAPCTIILPKLGIQYGTCLGDRTAPDLDGFWTAFEKTLSLVEASLLRRFMLMARQSPAAAPFMYGNGTVMDADQCKENVYAALRHNTLAIGFIGVAEMCEALFGVNHAHSDEAYVFAVRVVNRINAFAKEASERNNLNFSCYATPAESCCRTTLVNLRNQYGTIPNVTSREYLTNSFHVPVWEEVSIYRKLELEAPFTKLCTGGTITYIECKSTFMKNIKAIEAILHYAFDVLDIPYLAFNFPIDTCNACGYQDEFDDQCPECGSHDIWQLRRVTGYLTSDWHRFNEGKQAEVHDRVKHDTFTDFGERKE